MQNKIAIGIILVIAMGVLYLVTATSFLQRVSYDIYECSNTEHGKIKIWFTEIKPGRNFEFTENNTSSQIKIISVEEQKVRFERNNTSYILDIPYMRLTKDELGLIVFYECKLNEFRM